MDLRYSTRIATFVVSLFFVSVASTASASNPLSMPELIAFARDSPPNESHRRRKDDAFKTAGSLARRASTHRKRFVLPDRSTGNRG